MPGLHGVDSFMDPDEQRQLAEIASAAEVRAEQRRRLRDLHAQVKQLEAEPDYRRRVYEFCQALDRYLAAHAAGDQRLGRNRSQYRLTHMVAGGWLEGH